MGYSETVILRIQSIQGDGAVHTAGTRSPRPAAVLVTDETGAPVSGAMVSFRLPEDGASGTFLNGMRTDVTVTGADGVANAPGILWGSLAGPAKLRVTAAKDQARAGLLTEFFVALPGGGGGGSMAGQRMPTTGATPVARVRGASGRAWRWLLPVAAGGAAALALGVTRQSQSAGGPASAGQATAAAAALTIGAPSITIGRP
jgi:hypothetical protein